MHENQERPLPDEVNVKETAAREIPYNADEQTSRAPRQSEAAESAPGHAGIPAAETEIPAQIYRSAGFTVRLAAYLIDLVSIQAILALLVYWVQPPPLTLAYLGLSLFTIGIVGALYFLLMTRFWGQTLGKMITGIRVIQTDGRRPGWRTLLFREVVGRTLSQLAGLHLGYLWCAFHPRKQGWHDLISDTYVIYDLVAEEDREIRIQLPMPAEI